MLGSRFGWILAASVVLLPACFSEPKSELPPGCSLGQHLCPCNDDECDPGLTCSVSADVCVSIDCEVGALECPCGMEGACNPGLVCGEYKYCVPEDGTAATGTSDDPSGTMSASMSAGVTSESDSDATTMSTTTPVDPDTSVTDSDPTTTDADPTTDSDSESDPTMTTTRGESSSSTDDPSMTTAMTDSESDSDSSTSTTGIEPDPSISSTAVVTESDSLETTDATTSSSTSSSTNSTSTGMTTDAETGEFPDCQQCVEDAQSGACAVEWDACEAAAMMGNPGCMMNVSSYITCMQANGGDDGACLCFANNDPAFIQFGMCLSANCANECSCY
jgi:hypothetical protein